MWKREDRERDRPVGGRTLLTKIKIAFSALSLIRFRMT